MENKEKLVSNNDYVDFKDPNMKIEIPQQPPEKLEHRKKSSPKKNVHDLKVFP